MLVPALLVSQSEVVSVELVELVHLLFRSDGLDLLAVSTQRVLLLVLLNLSLVHF